MFNNFEQGHSEWLEPKWFEIVATDWKGEDIYEGDCCYYKAPNGDIVHWNDIPDWVDKHINDFFEEIEF